LATDIVDRKHTPCPAALARNCLCATWPKVRLSGPAGLRIARSTTIIRLKDCSNPDTILLTLVPFASAPFTGVYALRGRRIGQPEVLAALAESASAGTEGGLRSTLTVIRPRQSVSRNQTKEAPKRPFCPANRQLQERARQGTATYQLDFFGGQLDDGLLNCNFFNHFNDLIHDITSARIFFVVIPCA